MLEDLGNCVKIHDTVIPAVNIQVEGFPKFVDDTWYGIYFEILFEDGGLFIVSQYHQDGVIRCDRYPLWNLDEDIKDYCLPSHFDDWEGFLVYWEAAKYADTMFKAKLWEALMA